MLIQLRGRPMPGTEQGRSLEWRRTILFLLFHSFIPSSSSSSSSSFHSHTSPSSLLSLFTFPSFRSSIYLPSVYSCRLFARIYLSFRLYRRRRRRRGGGALRWTWEWNRGLASTGMAETGKKTRHYTALLLDSHSPLTPAAAASFLRTVSLFLSLCSFFPLFILFLFGF